jgi:hypothetical protein
MKVTVRYMLRPVAHCKEGCAIRSWGMTLNYSVFLYNIEEGRCKN